jgi:hypothetical protein
MLEWLSATTGYQPRRVINTMGYQPRRETAVIVGAGDGDEVVGASLAGTDFEPALSAPLWRVPSLLGWRHL